MKQEYLNCCMTSVLMRFQVIPSPIRLQRETAGRGQSNIKITQTGIKKQYLITQRKPVERYIQEKKTP